MGAGKSLTISIAAYNVESSLAAAIESCLVPCAADLIEVLVIDDGSTDDTAAIAQRYAKKYPNIVKVISKRNGGYGSTINAGIALATGAFFMVLDGDDELDSEGLERLAIDASCSKADLLVTQFVEVRLNKSEERLCDTLPGVSEGVFFFSEAMRGSKVAMHAYAFKTSMLRDAGIKITENCFYTDTEIALMPMAYVDRVQVGHYPVYRYALGMEGQSVSLEGRRRHSQDVFIVFNRLMDFYKDAAIVDELRREFFVYNLAVTASACYESAFLQKASLKNWRLLAAFDKRLRKHPEIYRCQVYLGKTRLFRMTRYLAYPYCAWRAVKYLDQ